MSASHSASVLIWPWGQTDQICISPTLLSGQDRKEGKSVLVCVYMCTCDVCVCVYMHYQTSTTKTVCREHSMGVDVLQEIPLPFPWDLNRNTHAKINKVRKRAKIDTESKNTQNSAGLWVEYILTGKIFT